MNNYTGNAITFNVPAGDVEVVASFAPIDYVLGISHNGLCGIHDDEFISALNNGDIHEISNLSALNIGDDVNLTAPEIAGYRFNSWMVTDASGATVNVTVSQNNSRAISFDMPANSVNAVAKYDTICYAVAVSQAGVCTTHANLFTETSRLKVHRDSVISLTAQDIAGYTFTGWTLTGVTVNTTTANTISFAMPAGNVTAVANYDAIEYTVVATAEQAEGSVVITGGTNGTFHYGDEATLEAVNTTCYHFSQWNDGNTDNPRTIVVDRDSTFEAMFERNAPLPGDTTVVICDSYTWRLNNITYTESGDYRHALTNADGCDSVVTLHLTIKRSTAGIDTIVALNSYKWMDSVTYTSNNNTATYTLTNAEGCDSVVTLNLSIIKVIDTTDNGEGGDVVITPQPDTTGTFDFGDTLAFTANAVACYHFVSWSDGDTANPRYVIVDGNDIVMTPIFARNDTLRGVDTIVAFNSYKWIDSVTYTEGNTTATWFVRTAQGCDSL